MPASFSVVVENRQVLEALAQLTLRMSPSGLRPAMLEIGESLAESTRRRFETSTAPDGTSWAPLAEGTVLARYQKMMGGLGKRHYKKDGSLNKKGEAAGARIQSASMKPLVDTGQLADSIRYQPIDGGAGVEVGTNRFGSAWEGGAAIHQFGSEKAHIPARPFFGLSTDDETTVLDILQSFLEDSFS
ncbi:MAG: phage virion morphogenesis protein [Zoogloeaceae bacterium]|jgi:phage gpG-like protein|nr:phage virion morphogenesis protein [Zoogloeaceae bacterium]